MASSEASNIAQSAPPDGTGQRTRHPAHLSARQLKLYRCYPVGSLAGTFPRRSTTQIRVGRKLDQDNQGK
jgi:hypothetical protein